MKRAIDEYHSSNGSVSVRQLARAWNDFIITGSFTWYLLLN